MFIYTNSEGTTFTKTSLIWRVVPPQRELHKALKKLPTKERGNALPVIFGKIREYEHIDVVTTRETLNNPWVKGLYLQNTVKRVTNPEYVVGSPEHIIKNQLKKYNNTVVLFDENTPDVIWFGRNTETRFPARDGYYRKTTPEVHKITVQQLVDGWDFPPPINNLITRLTTRLLGTLTRDPIIKD